jgi:ankyrin repeat protein
MTRDLLDAIEAKHTIVASQLIASGVNVNCTPSPLIRAASSGAVDIVTLLLDAGADIDAIDEHHKTACHAAIRSRELATLKLLIARGANLRIGESLLRANLHRPEPEIAIVLLDAGAPVDNLSPDDLIDVVVHSNSVQVLARLLALNVDVSALRDIEGNSLCHNAVLKANCDGDMDALVRASVTIGGVDINAGCDRGQTALHCAALVRNAAMLRFLVELGADIDRRENDGRTALHVLFDAWKDGAACAEMLLTLGANANAVFETGETALHLAAQFKRASALCSLVAAGGDLDWPDNNGKTPRQISLERGMVLPTHLDIDAARRRIAKARLDLVRWRALEICVGLQQLQLDALQLCTIMMQSFGVFGSLISFHQWWAIAVAVKHAVKQQ